jgi:ubiquinone/menaquinone biosynthesis C-methylase UbiE
MSKGFKSDKIYSFDLVSCKPFIKIADISKLPLEAESVDMCIFCLSLMGINYLDFIVEAYRVLNNNGELIIAEVESRSSNWKKFI